MGRKPRSWAEYDRLLAEHDRLHALAEAGEIDEADVPDEPDMPTARLNRDDPNRSTPSGRTEQRRRKWQREKVGNLLADGRVTHDSAVRRVTSMRTPDGRWRDYCANCGAEFTSARVDARYCSGRCRVAAHRARAGT